MSPELKQAVEERVALGHTKDQIAHELQTAGYDTESIEIIYTAVTDPQKAVNPVEHVFPRSLAIGQTAWQLMISRPDLVALLAVPTSAIGVLEYFNTTTTVTTTLPLAISSLIAGIALVIFIFLAQIAVLYAALKQAADSAVFISIKEGITWAAHNVFSLLWLMLLTGLVVLGGSLLLIIPGIIAAVYITFSQYAYVDEGVKGIAALERSRQLVYGRFSAVFWRLLGMMLWLIALYLPVAIIMAFSTALPETTNTLLTVILDGLVSGVYGVFTVFYLTTVYQVLKSQSLGATIPTSWYKIYTGVGVLLLFLIVSLPLLYMSVLKEFAVVSEVEVTPTRFQLEQAAFEIETQAALEAFQAEHQADFDSN